MQWNTPADMMTSAEANKSMAGNILPADAVCCPDINIENIENVVLLNIW